MQVEEQTETVIEHPPSVCCPACRENMRLIAAAVTNIAQSVQKFDELATMLDGSPAAKMLGLGG